MKANQDSEVPKGRDEKFDYISIGDQLSRVEESL